MKLLCLLCFLSSLTVWAETPDEHIFVFERSTNTNYVCYDINLHHISPETIAVDDRVDDAFRAELQGANLQ